MSVLQKSFILILGSPRSGTTWLHSLLSMHPNVASHPYELTIFSKYLGCIDAAWTGEMLGLSDEVKWKNGMPTLWSENTYRQVQNYLIEETYRPLLEKIPHATHILDKHPAYSHYGELIFRLLPDVKIIHLIRDGREVVSSMRSAAKRLGFGSEKIIKGSSEWKEHIQAIQALEKKYPDRILEVRYEMLYSHTKKQIAGILTFLGLDYHPDWLHACIAGSQLVGGGNPNTNDKARKTGTIWKSDLSVFDRLDFHRVAGDLLVQLGYEKDGSWILESAITRPIWQIAYILIKLLKRLHRAINYIITGHLPI